MPKEPRDITLQPTWPDRSERLEQERQIRPERLRRLREVTEQLFSGEVLAEVRKKIEVSFHVPQAGAHHNEGMFMDAHLEKIFNALDRIAEGQFPPEIPPEVQVMLTRVVSDPLNRDQLRRYVLLHDIDKANTLNVTYREKGKQAISWEQWQASVPADAQADPVARQAFMDAEGITSIGYYGHEAMGATTVAPDAVALGITPTVVKAIEKHGVSYNFSKLKLDTFQNHFGQLSREEMEWTVTASFIDSSASLKNDGEPDLDEFMNMCGAIHNTFIIRNVEAQFKPGGQPVAELDARKVAGWIKELRTAEVWITDTVDQLAEQIRRECQYSRYDALQLASQLQAEPLLTYRDQILATIDATTGRLDEEALKAVRRQLRRDNQLLDQALARSEVKS